MRTEGRVRVNVIDWITLALVIIGSLNWGLTGIGYFLDANWNIVNIIFADFAGVENAIYVLVGLAGIYELYFAYQLYAGTTETGGAERPA